MKYRQELALRLRRGDERCHDLSVEPTAETRRLLANHRLVLRPVPDGVRVLGLATGGKMFLPLAQGSELLFDLKIVNQDFALSTVLDEISEMKGPQTAPEYTNIDVQPAERAQPVELLLGSSPDRPPAGVLARVRLRHSGSDSPREYRVVFQERAVPSLHRPMAQ